MSKIILITGATSGIGKATSKLLASNGYSLILAGRRQERLDDLEREIKSEADSPVTTLCFDVRKYEQCAHALNSLSEDWKVVDILINNAGLAKGYDDIHEGSLDHREQMIDTNIKGLLYLTRLVTPVMVDRKSGHVINTC